MSLDLIYHFQSRLYELLASHRDLPKVYLAVQHDAKYPFILINLQRVINLSKYDIETYEVDFEICIFVRDKAQESILKMATIVNSVAQPAILSDTQHTVLGIKNQNIDWVRGHDLLTTKLVMSYKGLIQSL